mmetsp:Transcript_16169/g.43193  ORF Transcript_16169/g.43193 Transcript_16169/m.43193 type:complete len:469 (+) Transcript_16169:80-1486(+)
MASGAAAHQPDVEEDMLANTMATMSPVNSVKAPMASSAAASQPDMDEDPLAPAMSPMPSYDALAATTDPLAATTASAKGEAPCGRVGTVYAAGPPPDKEDALAATVDPGRMATTSSVKADDELAQSVGSVAEQGPPTAAPPPAALQPPTASMQSSSSSTPFGSMVNSMAQVPLDSPFGSVASSMAMPAPPGGAGMASMPFGTVAGSQAPLPPVPLAGPKTLLPGQQPAPLGGPRTMVLEQPLEQPLQPLGGPRTMLPGQPGEQPPEPLGRPKTMLPGQQQGPFSVGNGVMPSMPPAPELLQQSSEHQTMVPNPLQPGLQTSFGKLSTVDEGCEESQAGGSMPPGSLMSAGLNSFDAAFQAAPEAAFYPESQLYDAQMDVKFPHIKELDHNDVWYTVGDPEMRIDPHWRHDQWWLAAPVDFVGLEKHGCAKSERLAMVDLIVAETSRAGRMPPLPAPARSRNADDCPIC